MLRDVTSNNYGILNILYTDRSLDLIFHLNFIIKWKGKNVLAGKLSDGSFNSAGRILCVFLRGKTFGWHLKRFIFYIFVFIFVCMYVHGRPNTCKAWSCRESCQRPRWQINHSQHSISRVWSSSERTVEGFVIIIKEG